MEPTDKSLSDMGDEYIRQAEEMKKRIDLLKKELPKLKGKRLLDKRREILRLQTIFDDLLENGWILINYYGEETDD